MKEGVSSSSVPEERLILVSELVRERVLRRRGGDRGFIEGRTRGDNESSGTVGGRSAAVAVGRSFIVRLISSFWRFCAHSSSFWCVLGASYGETEKVYAASV